MDLPCTKSGNKHVVVFQDMFSKWPLVFAVTDQRAECIARLLCEEVVPMFGVPEALLSDRGTNLLSHLMLDVCRLLGIEKLNTTAYHPECDGMVERFNRTLKTMLRKRAAQFNNQWDEHLPALLWAYRNAPHDTTGEKPSFLLFGWDCRSTKAALLPVSDAQTTEIEDYREELIHTLSTARKTALDTIRKAQRRYKKLYDRRSTRCSYRVGQWVLIHFPSEETGRLRKLSRPWRGPYRITSCNETNITAVKVYFPRENSIQVYQLRVKPCPHNFPAGFYWYGTKRKSPGRPPRWVETILAGREPVEQTDHPISDSSPLDDGVDVLPTPDVQTEECPKQQPPTETHGNFPEDSAEYDATVAEPMDEVTNPRETSTQRVVTEYESGLNTDGTVTSRETTNDDSLDNASATRPDPDQPSVDKGRTRSGYSLRRKRRPPDCLK